MLESQFQSKLIKELMQQLKNGIWASGRVAYKKKNVDMV